MDWAIDLGQIVAPDVHFAREAQSSRVERSRDVLDGLADEDFVEGFGGFSEATAMVDETGLGTEEEGVVDTCLELGYLRLEGLREGDFGGD